ncbi:MAG: dTMP kinase [bacterium]|nr:dTMP kinase [bacterium]
MPGEAEAMMNPHLGFFIDIEGLDGSGASTQVEKVVAWFGKETDKKILRTKEPTDNVIGGLIRGALTRSVNIPMDALQLLFAADRAHHLESEIVPVLKHGGIVVTDRYIPSTVAFGSLDVEKEWLLGLNERFLLPDLTIFIRVDPAECVRRMQKSRIRLELFEDVEKLRGVWRGYEWVAKQMANVIILNGERPVEEVFHEIRSLIEKHPKYKKGISANEKNT